MKLLVDACAGLRLAQALRVDGHDVLFVGDWAEDPGDDEILARARTEERIVITRDKDFGTLAVRDRQRHCGIIRLVELPPLTEISLCKSILSQHETELRRGALITVDARRVRIRGPELA